MQKSSTRSLTDAAATMLAAGICLASLLAAGADSSRSVPLISTHPFVAVAGKGRAAAATTPWGGGHLPLRSLLLRRPQIGIHTIGLRGGTSDSQEEDDEDDEEKTAREALAEDEMRVEVMRRKDMAGAAMSIQAALEIPEEVPEGWDPCADWNLRVSSREWWKEMRERNTIMKHPTVQDRYFHSIRMGAVPWVKEMLDGEGDWGGKVDVNLVEEDERKWTGLHVAAARGNKGVVLLMLERGADVKWLTEDGCSAMHCAVTYGHTEMCGILLDAGADVNHVDSGGDAPLDLCVQYKRQETAKFLMERGAKSAKHALEEVEAKSEWIHDPLWPKGYEKDLLAEIDSDDGQDEDQHTSELERRIYACSSNYTFAERMVERAEEVQEWATEPSEEPPERDLKMGPDDGLLADDEGVNADSSSGWDPRVMASRRDYVSDPSNWCGDSDDDDVLEILKAPAMHGASAAPSGGGNGDGGGGRGGPLGGTVDVSTNEETEASILERAAEADARRAEMAAAPAAPAAPAAAAAAADDDDDNGVGGRGDPTPEVSASDWSSSNDAQDSNRKGASKGTGGGEGADAGGRNDDSQRSSDWSDD